MMKPREGGGGQGSHEYELYSGRVSGDLPSQGIECEMPFPPTCQPLPTTPLSVAPLTDEGAAKEGRKSVCMTIFQEMRVQRLIITQGDKAIIT